MSLPKCGELIQKVARYAPALKKWIHTKINDPKNRIYLPGIVHEAVLNGHVRHQMTFLIAEIAEIRQLPVECPVRITRESHLQQLLNMLMLKVGQRKLFHPFQLYSLR